MPILSKFSEALTVRLWKHFTPRRRTQIFILFFVSVITSFAEVLSIGALLPFLTVITNPGTIFNSLYMQQINLFFNFREPRDLLLPITIFFCISVILSGIMRVLLLWMQTRLSHAIGTDFSLSIYRKTLHQPYHVHINRNSSEVISGISNKIHSVVYDIITPLFVLMGSVLITFTIIAALIVIDPLISLITLFVFGLIYLIIILLTRKRLLGYSELKNREYSNVIKVLQEGLGSIRDVLIGGFQEEYWKKYKKTDAPLRRAQANVQIISGAPRFIIEAIGMFVIGILAYGFSQDQSKQATIIPVLGVIAMGAQRLLPVLQQAYSGWAAMRGGRNSLIDVMQLLDQPMPDYADKSANQMKLPFSSKIEFSNLSFRYASDKKFVLESISLIINKGDKVGIIGKTGSGKSTLLDITMGLLFSDEGTFSVDETVITNLNVKGWQSHISHVPQMIFLTDSSIAENIAFGIPKSEINYEIVKEAARKAQLEETILSFKEGYQSLVGERGINLSGGQRQRIGIARALYKNADFIIFDEATSALDKDTEEEVMAEIATLNSELTILIVAHRLTTLKYCNKIIQIENGKIFNVGTYSEIMKNHKA
jgi:ABC-type multidrug transport system fused ATPase/permease subunit